MNNRDTQPQIYLASASPRRQALLRQLGISFEVVPTNIPELRQAQEPAQTFVQRLARDKAQEGLRLIQARGLAPRPVVGADTEVVIEDQTLGKPHDRAHALTMLRRLSGRTHEVLTAVCVLHAAGMEQILSRSQVTFGALTDAQIARYWESGEPADKAGAYGIQGLGAAFIARLEGSYSGVMGLPLYELAQILHKLGITQQ